MKLALCSIVGALALASTALAEDLAVPITVREPAGVARTMFPASGGIPFAPGAVKDVVDLKLLDASGKPVPAQFTKLMAHDDGSVQWALVDVVVAELATNGQVEYTVRAGKPAVPDKPLSIEENDNQVVFDTGVVRFAVGKKQFQLFDSVTVGGKPVASGGEVSVTGGTGHWYEKTGPRQYEERTTVTHEGETFAAGPPRRVTWEYRGPVRATLRLDGDYVKGDQKWLGYTTRITAWVGSGLVRVEHTIRNSEPKAGADAYISRAVVGLKLAFDAKDAGPGPRPAAPPGTQPEEWPDANWSAGGDGQVGVLVQDWHAAGIYRGPCTYRREVAEYDKPWTALYGQKVAGREAVVEVVSQGPKIEDEQGKRGAVGFTKDGVFALADMAHKESEIWFDFYAGPRDAEANRGRARACRSKLLVAASCEWYGTTGCLSVGPFGTLADEIAAYKKWGWKGWDDAAKYPKKPHQPDAYVATEMMHEVTEGDPVEGWLLMWARTGQRGYFDWAEAFAGYFRGHAVYRRDWGPRWAAGGDMTAKPAASTAKARSLLCDAGLLASEDRPTTGQRFSWGSPSAFNWLDTRMHSCHHYASGLLDYYCLTGNTDARDAMLDLADVMVSEIGRYDHAQHSDFAGTRNYGRLLITMITAWRATHDPEWKARCDKLADSVLKAANWDAKMNYFIWPMRGQNPTFLREYCLGHVQGQPGLKAIPKDKPMPPRLDKYLTEHGITIDPDPKGFTAHKGDESWPILSLHTTFQTSIVHMGLERYAREFDSAAMKQRVVDWARGSHDLLWIEKCQYVPYNSYYGWPGKNMVLADGVWDASHDTCPGPGAVHFGLNAQYLSDICARAYLFSGDPKFLGWAERAWGRGSKRPYGSTKPNAGDKEVGTFANIRGSHHDFCLEMCAKLFYAEAHPDAVARPAPPPGRHESPPPAPPRP